MTKEVERHPGPWIGEDAELARACAMAAIKDYGSDDPDTHQRILKDGVWNDHVAVQAALAAIHNLRRAGLREPAPPAAPQDIMQVVRDEWVSKLCYRDENMVLNCREGHCRCADIAVAVDGCFEVRRRPEPLSDTHRPETKR